MNVFGCNCYSINEYLTLMFGVYCRKSNENISVP